MMQHRRTEPADRALLDGDQHLVVPRQLLHQRRVQRLGEPGVHHRRRQPARRQFVGRLQRIAQPRPQRQDGDIVALPQHAPLPQRHRLAALGQRHAQPVATRIAQRGRPVADRHRGRHRMHQFGLVGWRHQHEPRQAPQIRQIEAARVRRPVGTHRPRPVQREPHRQALDRHVMHHLVVGPLQERRIDGAERLHPLGRHSRGEGHRVLLGDAHVEACDRGTACRTGPARCPTASPR